MVSATNWKRQNETSKRFNYLESVLTNDGKYDKEMPFKILRNSEEFR